MQQLRASAPGSLMLMGEYAVLDGKPAISCAINQRIIVTLSQRYDENVEIHSALLGSYSTTMTDLTIKPPFQFVLGVLKHFEGRIKRGFDIEITSEFSDQVGLGSSAAVTVATLAAIISSMGVRMSAIDLIRQGRQIVRSIQGMGSGADIAAAVHGGVVSYQAKPLSAEKLSIKPPITVLYCGYKTKTVDAIKHVEKKFAAHSNLLRALYASIGQCSLDALQALRKEDWQRFANIMNIQQGLMESLGVSTPLIQEMICDLRSQSKVQGAKISGSGMGDCVIGLQMNKGYQYIGSSADVQSIPVEVTLQGVQCEKI